MGRPVSQVFVGRDVELARLGAALDAATGGRPAIVLLDGEAGVGKTRLLREFTARATTSASLLYGRCLPVADGELPFAPFVEAFRDADADGEASAFPIRISADAGSIPSPRSSRALAIAGWTTQTHVFELVLERLRRLASSGPLALVLEDLHWADHSSRELLLFLARNLSSEAVLLLATYRSDELHRRHPLLTTLSELARLPGVDRIELGRLTTAETRELLRSLGTPELPAGLVEEIADRSEGVPFHAEELLAASLAGRRSSLTPSLMETLTVRLAALPPDALRLVHTASAIGRRADHRLLAEVTGFDGPRAIEAVRAAVDLHILDPVEADDGSWTGYEFRHALLAEAAYRELLPAERLTAHEAIATALERGPADPGATAAVHAAELAYHWDRANVPERALAAAIVAGSAADRARASAEALGQYRRALGLWTRVDQPVLVAGMDEAALLGLAADAANAAGDPSAATRLATSGLERLPAEAPVERRVALLEALYFGHWESGQPAEARAALQAALALLPAAVEPRLRARILSFVGWTAFLEDRFEDARTASEEAVALARGTGDAAVERLALFSLASVLLHVGEVTRSEQILRRVADEGAPTETAVVRARCRMADLLIEAGRPDEAAAILRAVIEGVRATGAWASDRELLGALLASALVPSGGWREAAAVLDEVIGDPPSRSSLWPLFYRTWLRVWQGDVAGAAEDLAAAERMVGTTHNAMSAVRYVRALVAHAQGRFEDARGAIREIVDLNADVRYDTLPIGVALGMEVEADRAVAAAALRNPEEVAEARRVGAGLAALMDRILAASGERAGMPTLRGLAARVTAERSRLDGDADPDAFDEAARRLDTAGRPFEAARCRFRAAEARLEAGRPRSEAAEPLRAAWQTAAGLGANGLVRDIEALAGRSTIELQATRPTRSTTSPRVAVPADPYGLTPRELSVLALLAAGHSNRQIAERLFIAESTAGVHVSNVIGKLGVRGRAGAAAIGVRLGLVADPGPETA
ncbi:MAG TPA: AAA family ATPase [Candidatus Limnocylindrales bacterium]|nr:AAA family ATPase [Candidatus Limnocylindrales bacterium]